MPLERVFLGTGSHCLHAVVDLLLERRIPGEGEWDLSTVLLVLPVSRAIRRLEDLLAEQAIALGLHYVPPTMTTLGGLADTFIVPEHARPTQILEQLAWLRVLRDAPPKALAPLLGRGGHTEESIEELARRLSSMARELGGAELRFSDVAEHDAIAGSFDAERWRAMGELQCHRDSLLQQASVETLDMAMCRVLKGEAPVSPGVFNAVFYISADLNAQQRGMLDRLSEAGLEILAMVHAGEHDAEAFDAHGCTVPEAWTERALPVSDDLLRIVDGPDEQAVTILDLMSSVDEVDTVDSVSVGVPDADLLPTCRRVLSEWGVSTHDPAGRPIGLTSIGLLLVAVENFLEHGHAADIAPLLRHPWIETWLATLDEAVVDPVEAYDRFLEESVPLELSTFFPARHKAIHDAIKPLILQLQPMRHAVESVAERAGSLRSLLETWITPSFESLADHDMQAIDVVLERLADFALADEVIAGSMTASAMLRVLLSSLSTTTIRTVLDTDGVELLGWLDCHLDDAPVLLLAGCNEGIVPSSINADPFLPNELRRRLGLVDNDRRYARDAFLLEAMLNSGRTVRIIVGRCGPEGDPLRPSRLLLTGNGDETVARVLAISRQPTSAPITPRPSESVDLFAPCPRPDSLREIKHMSVTSFRDYLACPYRYMLKHVLRLRTRDDRPDELDGGVFGTLAHLVLERFGRREIALGSPMCEERIVGAELDELLDELIKERFGRSRLPSVHLQLETLRGRLHSYAKVHASQARDGWMVHAVEASFGEDGPGRPCDNPPAPLPGEPRIRLVGKIDRIDVHPELGWRAIDYKTGDAAKGVIKVHCSRKKDAWFDLQLPLYRHLLRSISIEVEPRHMCYMLLPSTLEDTRLDVPDWTDDELLCADEVARQVAVDVLSGRFDPSPDYRSPWDDWSRICGTNVIAGSDDPGGDESA